MVGFPNDIHMPDMPDIIVFLPQKTKLYEKYERENLLFFIFAILIGVILHYNL